MNLGVTTLLVAIGVFLIWAVQKGYSKNFAAAWQILKGEPASGTSTSMLGQPSFNAASLITNPMQQGLGAGVVSPGTFLIPPGMAA